MKNLNVHRMFAYLYNFVFKLYLYSCNCINFMKAFSTEGIQI